MAARGLTQKQRLFVEAYVGPAKGNAADAARRAGYKGDNAQLASIGQENLTKPHIANAVLGMTPKIEPVADREERMAWLSAIVRGDGEYAVASLRDRLKAAEMLAKMQGDYVQRVEVSVGAEVKIVAEIPDNGRRVIKEVGDDG